MLSTCDGRRRADRRRRAPTTLRRPACDDRTECRSWLAVAAMGQHTIAVIGVGTVGQSWAALFLSYGNRVRLWDPAHRLAERFAAYLDNVVTEEPLPPQPQLGELWQVCDTVEEALEGVTYVQENAPENMDTKQAMLRQIDEALPTDVVVGSSTSSFLLVDMIATCTRAASRVVLSHPFNRESATQPRAIIATAVCASCLMLRAD
eukprot:COSAG02_NODE_1069_length_14810_cov_6.729998_5_plen_205_part_00